MIGKEQEQQLQNEDISAESVKKNLSERLEESPMSTKSNSRGGSPDLYDQRNVNAEQSKKTSSESITAGEWYRQCLNVSTPPGGWFGLVDCTTRYLLSVVFYYFYFICTPISLTIYTFKFNQVWYPGLGGLMLSLMGPFIPIGIVLMEACKKVKELFGGDNWQNEGEGATFFVKPPSAIADFIWSCYINQSMFIGQYALSGTNPDAIQHTWFDTILTKDFWRSTLEKVGARVPLELARWTGQDLIV